MLDTLWQPLLGPSFLVQVQLAVNTIDTFVVPTVMSAQHLETFPKAPARMFVDHRIDSIDDLSITIVPCGYLVIGRPRESEATATASHRQTMLSNQVSDSFALIGRP